MPNIGCYKMSDHGQGYVGTISETRSDIECQSWSSQDPHSHRVTDMNGDSNFCRNPNGDVGGPWCFTTDPLKRWESCDVPTCGGMFQLIRNCEISMHVFRRVHISCYSSRSKIIKIIFQLTGLLFCSKCFSSAVLDK